MWRLAEEWICQPVLNRRCPRQLGYSSVSRAMRLGPRPAGPCGFANCCFTIVCFGWTSSYRNSAVSSPPSSISICYKQHQHPHQYIIAKYCDQWCSLGFWFPRVGGGLNPFAYFFSIPFPFLPCLLSYLFVAICPLFPLFWNVIWHEIWIFFIHFIIS